MICVDFFHLHEKGYGNPSPSLWIEHPYHYGNTCKSVVQIQNGGCVIIVLGCTMLLISLSTQWHIGWWHIIRLWFYVWLKKLDIDHWRVLYHVIHLSKVIHLIIGVHNDDIVLINCLFGYVCCVGFVGIGFSLYKGIWSTTNLCKNYKQGMDLEIRHKFGTWSSTWTHWLSTLWLSTFTFEDNRVKAQLGGLFGLSHL
jgi:hypothetical protein